MTSRNEHNKFAAQVSATGKETARRRGLAKRVLKGARAVATKTVSIITAVTLAMYGIVPAAFAVNDEEAQVQNQEQTVEQTLPEVTAPSETIQPEEPAADAGDAAAVDDGTAADPVDDSGTSPDVDPAIPDTPDTPGQATDETVDPGSSATDSAVVDAIENPATTNAEKPLEHQAGELKTRITTAEGYTFEVTLVYGADAQIPENAELKVIEVNQEPSVPNWKQDPAYKHRPLETEKFITAKTMKKRMAAIEDELNVRADEGDAIFYAQLLDLAITVDGKTIKPAAAVEVSIETDELAKPDPYNEDITKAAQKAGTVMVDEAAYQDVAILRFASDNKTAEELGRIVELAIAEDPEHPQDWDRVLHTTVAFDTDEMAEFAIAGIERPGLPEEEEAAEQEAQALEAASAAAEPQTLTATDYRTYAVTVTYGADAAIPSDARLEVRELTEIESNVYGCLARASLEVENPSYLRAFDISLVGADGTVYEPKAAVDVSISLADLPQQDEESDVKVLHFDGATPDVVDVQVSTDGDAANDEAVVEFTTESFSVYLVVGTGGQVVVPQRTYTFFVPNNDVAGEYTEYPFTDSQGKTVYAQTITSGDELVVPQLTSTETEVFAGWYEGHNTGGAITLKPEPYDFDNITIDENGAVQLYAVYKTYAKVVFHDQYDTESGSFPIAHTRRAELVTGGGGDAATVKITDLGATYTNNGGPNMAFLGWSETPVKTPGVYEDEDHNSYVIATDPDGCITVTGEKHLYPLFKEVHRLTYYAAQSGKGADYVPPANYFKDDAISGPLPTTAMDGYTFDGWWVGTLTTEGSTETVNYSTQITDDQGRLVANADDGPVYISNGNLYLRADATLYAKWTSSPSNTAAYTIVVKTQNPSDAAGLDEANKTYVYRESVVLQETIGKSVSVPDEYTQKQYQGYTYSHCDEAKTIAADGSTVLNVYYDKDSGYVPGGPYTLSFVDSITGEGKTSKDLPVKHNAVAYGTPIADMVPADPTSGRNGYEFSAWYLDPECTIEANLENMTMPDHDLTIYAGWETGWYVVSIDPNYGALYAEENGDGTGSTWFWSSYEGEPIGEYTHVTRDYVESSSGTWYYVYHDGDGKGGDNGWPDRNTYYTQNPSKATEDTTFEYAPGTYTYIGWYEVLLDENGNEIGEAAEPYDFSKHTDHNTKLRLHWKKAGTYFLKYSAVVTDGETTLSGTMDDGASPELFVNGSFADYASVTLSHSANAPEKYTFVGWKVRGSDDRTIYKPGQVFILHANDASRVSGKDVICLDAVYVKVDTASITYDANGGTVVDGNVDFGQVPGATAGSWQPASGTVDAGANTATAYGITNNSRFKLSDGTGFVAPQGSDAVFLGWSDKAVCDETATFYDKNSTDTYAINTKEPKTLYAVWGAHVTYNLNSADAGWGETWDPATYTFDGGTNTYSQDVKLGNAVSEPTNVPVYTGDYGLLFRYWATKNGSEYTPYDFSQPVAGTLNLYAYWSEPNVVKVHAVDASSEALLETADESGWTVNDVTVTTAAQELNGTSNVTAPANYEFAFAAVSDSLDSVSEGKAVTAIKYDSAKKCVAVKYDGDTEFTELEDGQELYFVYYEKKALNIGYKSMAESGVLANVTATGAPATTGDALLGEYAMSDGVSDPLSLTTGFTNYAFAIGDVDPGGGADMNASSLSMVTDAAGSDDPVPTLRIRNTWRGFQYTTQTGDDAEWTSCGYNPQLYVVYYAQTPTVVLFHEKTVGASAVVDTEFTFDLLVTQTTTTTVSVQTQKKNDQGDWVNDGDPVVTTTTSDPTTVFDTRATGNQPYILKNGEASSAVLFHSSSVVTGDPVTVDASTQTVTTTTTTTTQTAKIEQTGNSAFSTKVKAAAADEVEALDYTYTADGSGGTQNVIFTNTHKSLPVEVHVAMVENNGTESGVFQRDDDHRDPNAVNYKFDLALGDTVALLDKLPSASVFLGDEDTYAFGTIVYGTGSEGTIISAEGSDVASIGYEQIEDNVYELVLRDGDGNKLGELGSNSIYYLYYPMPKIKYVKEAADGTLTDVTGSLLDPETGSIDPSDSVTYSHEKITMNGKEVAQNESVEIPGSGLVISQFGNFFRMPPVLDDDLYARYLSYAKLGVGNGSVGNVSDLEGVSTALTMQLKVQNSTLQYSFDGIAWQDLSGTPTVYAIYDERGYDLQISKTVDTSESGEDPIFAGSSYDVTISSMAITKTSYEATGAESATVAAVPASGDTPGTITFTVKDGTKVRIKALGRGEYTITESGNENYTLTAKSGPIVGGTTRPMEVTDNKSVSLTLDTEMKVDLTNSPKAICKVGDQYFYTLKSMVSYVEEFGTGETTAEMLTDYLMPAEDTLEIPQGVNLILTTADSVGHVAVITRTADLAESPMVVNNGTLALTSLTLDGNEIQATAPIIQSAGNLTIGNGSTIENAINTSNDEDAVLGGAINATAGDITVSGVIDNCEAAAGGAIYHSGHGTITVNGNGAIRNNAATSGDGGAIYLASGTVKVSGTSNITGNNAAAGNGGAIYVSNAAIEVDQGGRITGNTAKEGGAIYAETGTITVSKTEGISVEPAITGNSASTGNGGAIHVGAGSVTVSGGEVSNNNAAAGNGGAIYADTASVEISATAELNGNGAKAGGAVYAASGAVTVSGGMVESNTASAGNGGAIYAGSGNVAISGGAVQNNSAAAGNGGAVFADSGNVSMAGGSLTQNTANANGGAIYAGSGTVTLSVPNGATAPVLSGNAATTGNGGAIYTDAGAVSITGTTLTGNSAGTNGGAVFSNSGAVSAADSTFGGSGQDDGNTAGTSGGAIYATSGNVTLSGGSMIGNVATSGNGGAVYAGSGVVAVSGYAKNNVTIYTQFTGNQATSGNGGAVYVDSGSATLTSATATENSAINGAAVYAKTGMATFNAGSYTGNIASNGGAVGVGDVNARLYFTGNVQVKNNTLGSGGESNVYLDQDDDAVINIDALGANAAIGIYVPDEVVNIRSVPGARFAIYSSDANVSKITNDRFESLTVQTDTAAKKLFWGKSILVEVRYLASYANFLPDGTEEHRGVYKATINNYYPSLDDQGKVALSELAADVYSTNTISGLSATAAYGGAFYYNAPDYSYDITTLVWNMAEEKWQVVMRNGNTADLPGRIYLIYAEPAYISIENNTDMPLNVNSLTMSVNGSDTSVITKDANAGYGMVFAKNGAIRSALLPITEDDLALSAHTSINLLIPGGQGMAYKLDGVFGTTEERAVRLRRGAEDSLVEQTIQVSSTGDFYQLTGSTLSTPGTYHVIFGDDKYICKVVDADGIEHPYSKISLAIADIKNGAYSLATPKTAVIEMLTDYLLPASDYVLIPRGYDITLTTAAPEGTEGVTYTYNGESEDGRAIISRDSENTNSMIDAWNGDGGTDTVSGLDGTTLRINNLVFDGKSVRGSSDGGAVGSKYVNVYIDNVDFKNVYASNGGAMLVMFSAKDKNNKATVPKTVLEVKNSNFTGCTSTTTVTSNRLGGGAIVTNAETMTLENCNFDTCTAVDQAGAVFHRVDGNYNSWTNITGCTFTNCSANAAGGLELDSKTIEVRDTTFEHCVAKARNGGGFNIYALNNANPGNNSSVTLKGCTFNDCQANANQYGGGFRSNSQNTSIADCTFTNCQAKTGGGFAISATNAAKGEVYGCTFERCTSVNGGGGIHALSTELVISDCRYIKTSTDISDRLTEADAKYLSRVETENGVTYYTYVFTSDTEAETFKDAYGLTDETIETKQSQIRNCSSANDGGGVYHNRDVNSSSMTITNSVITSNRTTGNTKSGGGVYTKARTVSINDAEITDNTCTNKGGGVYADKCSSMTITDSDISRNTSSSDGGGVWNGVSDSSLAVEGSTIDGNASNGNGGGIYTQAKTVTIKASTTKTDVSGNAVRSSVSSNRAKVGGGIYQNRNVAGSKLEIEDVNINGNNATAGGAGGIYANVRTLKAVTSEISRNSATGNGGGIWFDGDNDTNRASMMLTIEGSAIDGNTSNGNGGGIYTLAKTAVISSHTKGEGDAAVTTRTAISNNTTAKNGGGIYQDRGISGSALTVSGTDIKKNTANGTAGGDFGGGGVYANIQTMTFTDSEVSGNSAAKNGGGIYKNGNNTANSLVIDSSTVKDNSAGNQGGGIYDLSQLWLRNDVKITGNRLTTNTVANCAGVYLNDGRTLIIGPENPPEDFKDTIIVRDNTAADGTPSNLRLWSDGTQNNVASVLVYCDLNEGSEIRVVNAAKVGTQFGSSTIEDPYGFADDFAVFKADASTLHGIIDRNDPDKKRIIWAGPPIAKITDGYGNLLFMKTGFDINGNPKGSSPAIFDRLGTGNDAPSTVAAFNMLCADRPVLYNADGTLYEGNAYCIKMLDNFETPAYMRVANVAGRTITFTTAGKGDTDGYPFKGSGTRATVTRGPSVAADKSTLNAYGSLVLTNIIVDGGSESGVTQGKSTRCLWVETAAGADVVLGESALLQNATVSSDSRGGGGAYIQSGTFRIEGGTIRNCTANNGGGVYENTGTLVLGAGSIYQCTATGNGGGVYLNDGQFTMSGGSISNGSAASGGGVYVANHRTFDMIGGSIVRNHASTTGGGIAVGGTGARLNFSGRVNVSGNTSDRSVAADGACNVELNQSSKSVINTNNGGLYAGSYIGVYVPGSDTTNPYKDYGGEKDNFGTFADGDNTTTFYSFVNDRNGLKGGIIENAQPNTIYWIQIFSLTVSKEVEAGNSTTLDPEEPFLFEVRISGNATVTGQLNARDIDSSTGDYGAMEFTSNGRDTTTAYFTLKDGESITGVNLSEGLTYNVIEYAIVSGGPYTDQQKRYAAMPMNGYNPQNKELVYEGTTYTVREVNSYSGIIGENKGREDIDPYTSAVEFTNLMPICKITDSGGNLLYRQYIWNDKTFYAPAVYTELTGDNGAFKALEGDLYTSNGDYPQKWVVDNGVQIKMLIGEYNLNEAITADTGKVTLTTASDSDALFPKQDAGVISVIKRNSFDDASMLTVSGDLTLTDIALDGVKGTYTVGANGGIANVPNGGNLTIAAGARLENSKTAEGYYGGAVYVADRGTATMTGGTINKNASVSDGAGIYLAQGGKLNLSDAPNFGGKGTDVSGNITTTNGNFKDGELIAELNGGKSYTKARQDIYIAGYAGDDGAVNAASLVVAGNMNVAAGSIWVWAAESPHYKSLQQFARVDSGVTASEASCSVFRNARDDATTENETGDYLYGTLEGETPGYVYWNGLSGNQKVILKKVLGISGGANAPLSGAVFDVYRGISDSPYVVNTTGEVLRGLQSDSGGAFWIGTLPYGTYYLHETATPSAAYQSANGWWYFLIIDGSGVHQSDQYGTRDAARTAAEEWKASHSS